MTTGNKENTRHCIEAGVVSGFDCVLSCKNNEVLICALDGITKMCETVSAIPGGLEALATEIEETGCLDKIEELQQNENEVRTRLSLLVFYPLFRRSTKRHCTLSTRTSSPRTTTSTPRLTDRVTTSSMHKRMPPHLPFNFN